jgi:hypothetical protein
MKIFRLSILFVCLLPNMLQADPDAERSAEAAKMVNAFAAAHHRLLPAGNVLTSPWSIETNMAMVYAGAEGQTREAMRKAFFFRRTTVCTWPSKVFGSLSWPGLRRMSGATIFESPTGSSSLKN